MARVSANAPKPVLLLVVLMAVHATATGPIRPVPCTTSEATQPLCSVGKVKGPFQGDIHTDAGLFKALEARSYAREIIILLGSAGRQLLPLLQTVQDLELLGYAHVLPLAKDAATCATIARHLPTVGCAHSGFSLGLSSEVLTAIGQPAARVDLFHNRWRTAARAVQASYNVLLIDTDVLLLDDPYKYFKSAPFSNYRILAQAQFGPDEPYASSHEADPGIVYVQNADPSGAAAWLVAEVADRQLRWMDSNSNTISNSKSGLNKPQVAGLDLPPSCGVGASQTVGLNDALAQAAAAGRLPSPALLKCGAAAMEAAGAAGTAVLARLLAESDAAIGWGSRMQGNATVPLPPDLQRAAGGAFTPLVWIDLHTPTQWGATGALGTEGGAGNGVGQNSNALIGAAKDLFPANSKRGSNSNAFREQLTAACKAGPEGRGKGGKGVNDGGEGKCGPWPDPSAEGGSVGVVAAVGEEGAEKLLLLPPWMASGYHQRGRQGYWSTLAGEQGPQQVLGHAQSVVGCPSTPQLKAHLRMVYGAYHWDTVVHKSRGKGAYFASRSAVQDDVPGVVTVHPDLLLSHNLTQEQYVTLLETAVQVAHFSRKAVGWPSVPCSLPWVLGSSSTLRPWPASVDWIPHLSESGELMCTETRQLASSCLSEGQGVTPLELEHMRERYRLYRPMDPSPEKTLMAKGRANPDFTKKLLWQPIEQLSMRDLATQVVKNLIMLPGSGFVSPTTHYRMHAVYIGQAMKLKYDSGAEQYTFHGDRPLYEKHLPDKVPADLAAMFESFKQKCVGGARSLA